MLDCSHITFVEQFSQLASNPDGIQFFFVTARISHIYLLFTLDSEQLAQAAALEDFFYLFL
jgi:hypothetical protein